MGWFARSELRTVAPTFSPPSASGSTLSSGSRLMSITWPGRSTFNFIRSSKVVPPATNRVLRAVELERLHGSAPRLGLAAGLLDGGDDVGIGAATTDVAAHAFADIGVVRPAGLLEQCD